MSDPEILVVEWALDHSEKSRAILEKLTSLEALNSLGKDDLHYIVESLNRLYDNPSLDLRDQIYLVHKWPLLKCWIEPIVGEGLLH